MSLRMTREQGLLAVTALLSAGAVGWTVAGWRPVEAWRPPPAEPRAYIPPRMVRPAFADPDPDRYVAGRDPFQIAIRRRALPQARLDPPAPPRRPWAVPPFRPWPEADPGLPALVETAASPTAAGGGPTPADLPPADALAALQALPSGPPPERADRRADRDRPLDVISVIGKGQFEGKVQAQTPQEVQFRTKEGILLTVAVNQIQALNLSRTHEEIYRDRLKSLTASDAPGHLKLAEWCLEKGMIPEAHQSAERAVAAGPKTAEAYLRAAELNRELFDLDGEFRICREGLSREIHQPELLWKRLADLYLGLGMTGPALDAYQAAVRRLPTFTAARVAAADLLLAAGRTAEAAAEYQRALGFQASNPDAMAGLGFVALAQGKGGEAAAQLRKALGFQPRHARALNALGSSCVLQKKWKEAAEAFRAAVEADPAALDGRLNLGAVCLAAGRGAEAEALYRQTLKRNPASARALAGLGLAAVVAGKPDDEARKHFEAARDADPSDPYPHYALGRLALKADRPEDAEAPLLEALRRDDAFRPARLDLGAVEIRLGRYDRAAALLAPAATGAGPGPRLLAGLAALGRRDLDGADAAFADVLKSVPDHAAASLGRALILYYRQDVDGATAILERYRGVAFADEALARIEEARSQAFWEDDFDRPDDDEVGYAWVESQTQGIEIRVEGKRVVFRGARNNENWGLTSLDRPTSAAGFIRVESTFVFGEARDAVAGLMVAYNQPARSQARYAVVGRTESGQAGFGLGSLQDRLVRLKPVADLDLPAGKPFRLTIARSDQPDQRRSEFLFYVDDRLVGKEATSLGEHTDPYGVILFGEALKGRGYEFSVDDVKIVERIQDNK